MKEKTNWKLTETELRGEEELLLINVSTELF